MYELKSYLAELSDTLWGDNMETYGIKAGLPNR